jgi:hypothetical protein
MTEDQRSEVGEILRRLGPPRQYPDRRPGDVVEMPLQRVKTYQNDAVTGLPLSFTTSEGMKVRLQIAPQGDRFIVLGLVL